MNIYQILLLASFAMFYAAFCLKLLFMQRNGIRGFQLGKGKKQKQARTLEIALQVSTFVAATVQLASTLWLKPAISLLSIRILGLVLAFAGGACFIAAMVTMRDSWRVGVDHLQPTKLVTHGIYAFSRNPAYVGFYLLYLGGLLAFFSWPAALFSLIAAVLIHLQILAEERFLVLAFGEEYLQYSKHVRRYLGFRKNANIQ